MNIKSISFFVMFFSSFSLLSETSLYGKLWISIEHQEKSMGSESELVSNASRIGLKGNLDLGNELTAIYQLEYEVDPIDGTADETKERSLKQRNSFIGLKGFYGTLFMGTHDTAFKKSQKKIDIFNDLSGDIKNILLGENRMKDFIGFKTPKSKNGFSATFNAIKGSKNLVKNKVGDYLSYSLNYEGNNYYAAVAIDADAKGYDSTRYSFHLPMDIYTFGVIYQESKKINSNKTESGFAISALRKIGSKGEIKIQLAESDMKLSEGKQFSLGYDYNLSKQFKLFFFHSDLSTLNVIKEKKVTAFGFEFKF